MTYQPKQNRSSLSYLRFFKQRVLIPILLLCLLVLPGCRIKSCQQEDGQQTKPENYIFFGNEDQPINIVMWYVFEDPRVMQTLATKYNAKHKYVTITPKQITNFSEYLDELLNKSGTDLAPDIYFIRHDWLPRYYRKLAPMSETNLKRDPDAVESVDDYVAKFFPALGSDMIMEQNVIDETSNKETTKRNLYGIPWGFEGLALFVNKGHFEDYNKAFSDDKINVPLPTQTMTWNELSEASQKLIYTSSGWAQVTKTAQGTTVTYDKNKVVRYGAALGTAVNVQHAPDIFTTYLMQQGIGIVSDDHETVEFIKSTNTSDAVSALNAFASYSEVWDSTWPDSINAFANGKVSLAFGRSYQVPGIEKNSSLNFSVVPFPQRTSEASSWVTPAYYWVRVVNRDCEHPEVAWDFIKFVASTEEMQVYSEATLMPPARPELLDSVNMNSNNYAVYIQALPYTKTWYKGDADDADKAISDAITMVAQQCCSQNVAQQALTEAAKQLEQILKEYE